MGLTSGARSRTFSWIPYVGTKRAIPMGGHRRRGRLGREYIRSLSVVEIFSGPTVTRLVNAGQVTFTSGYRIRYGEGRPSMHLDRSGTAPARHLVDSPRLNHLTVGPEAGDVKSLAFQRDSISHPGVIPTTSCRVCIPKASVSHSATLGEKSTRLRVRLAVPFSVRLLETVVNLPGPPTSESAIVGVGPPPATISTKIKVVIETRVLVGRAATFTLHARSFCRRSVSPNCERGIAQTFPGISNAKRATSSWWKHHRRVPSSSRPEGLSALCRAAPSGSLRLEKRA